MGVMFNIATASSNIASTLIPGMGLSGGTSVGDNRGLYYTAFFSSCPIFLQVHIYKDHSVVATGYQVASDDRTNMLLVPAYDLVMVS